MSGIMGGFIANSLVLGLLVSWSTAITCVPGSLKVSETTVAQCLCVH